MEAGQYSLLKVLYSSEEDIPSGEYSKVVSDTVSLQWQTYSVSPYRYCNERQHEDRTVDSDGELGEEDSATAKSSVRRHIEMAFTQNAQNSESNPYRWEQQNVTRQLTEAEMLIMNKVAAGVNPVFHYPLVQHTRVVETTTPSSGLSPDVNTGIDVIATLPSSVREPINQALNVWTNSLSGSFIYCGQAVSYTTRQITDLSTTTTLYTYTVVDTFEGALDPDKNFYNVPGGTGSGADDRWRFGIGPQPSLSS